MPTFAELLSRFSFIAANSAAWGAIIAAGLIVIFFDWRTLVLAFASLAVLSGLLFAQLLPPQVAGVKMMVGLLVAVQLFVTGRQIHSTGPQPSRSAQPPGPRRITTGFPFRVGVAGMMGLLSWQAAESAAIQAILPDVPPVVTLAAVGLAAMGLIGLGLTEEPFKAGMLLLIVMAGFELYYAAVEPALAVMALMAAMNFSIALAACYLAVIKHAPTAGPPQ